VGNSEIDARLALQVLGARIASLSIIESETRDIQSIRNVQLTNAEVKNIDGMAEHFVSRPRIKDQPQISTPLRKAFAVKFERGPPSCSE
jgi:hypothetical protein